MKSTIRLAASAILIAVAGASAAQDNEMSFFLTSADPVGGAETVFTVASHSTDTRQ